MSYRKGISSLVSATLLIAISLSVAFLASTFFQSLTKTTADQTSEDAQRVSESIDYSLDIVRASQDLSKSNVEVVLKNTGKANQNITVTVFCSGENFQKRISGLNESEVRVIEFADVTCKPNKVSAGLEQYPVETETDNVDVSGSNTFSISNFGAIEQTSTDILFNPLRLGQTESSNSESSSYTGSKTNLTTEGGVLKLEQR